MDRAFTEGQAAPTRGFFRHCTLVGLALATLVSPVAAQPVEPLALLVASAPIQARPALWEVRDGDTTIYLFGTFHTLDQGTSWFEHSVRAAFDTSRELVLETIAPTDPHHLRAIGRAVVGPRPASNGFLSATRSAVERGRANGLSVDRGADNVLRRAAARQGKILSGIEAFSEQLRTFSQIPAAAPATPSPYQRPPVTLDELLAAWKSGDTRAFSNMLAGFEAKSPTAYRMLITDRNALYGNWIEHRLDQPGTVFVAVGSGHLAGKHSVQNWLSSRGIEARRIA